MSIFTNKHVVISLIVAPILAILSYLFVDQLVKPDAIPAQAGQTFPLVAKSNCRYDSGKCTLKNGDIEITLTQIADSASPTTIEIESAHPIAGFRYSLVDNQGQEFKAEKLTSNRFTIAEDVKSSNTTLRIAMESAKVIYFAETPLSFIK